MRFSRFPALVLTASALSLSSLPPTSASAAPPLEAEAKASTLKSQGDDHMRAKRYEDALAAYEEAFQLSKDPILHYNRGRAWQFLARYPDALVALRLFEAEAPATARARVPTFPDLLAEVKTKVATLHIDLAVPGARVLLGKRQIGVTPFEKPTIAVNAGPSTLEVVAEGYLPFTQDVDLKGDEALTEIAVTLVPKSQIGVLVVKSRVAGAHAEVDGKPIGVVPAEAPLRAGKHALVVTYEGYDPARTQVVVDAGKRKEIELDPLTRTPIYKKWWFWTAIGTVAAGAVLTVVLVTTEGPPPTGTFTPGQVRF